MQLSRALPPSVSSPRVYGIRGHAATFSGFGIVAATLTCQVDNEDEEGGYPLDKPRNPTAVFPLAEKVDSGQEGERQRSYGKCSISLGEIGY